jgi:hypothetical protein
MCPGSRRCSARIARPKGDTVSLNELLALLGRAWSRLLIFPGGLAAFAIIGLLAYIHRAAGRGQRAELKPPTSNLQPPTSEDNAASWFLALGAIAPPWLGLALLPLPPAPGLSRQTDLLITLALLECPLLLSIAHELRASDLRPMGLRRLAATLNGYPPLLLATLALVQAGGSFDIATIARVPGDLAPMFARPLHWIGAAAWALALPPMLGLGSFAGPPGARATRPDSLHHQAETARARLRVVGSAAIRSWGDDPLGTGLRLRALGHVLLAALPWMAAFGALDEGGLGKPAGLAAWLLAPALIAALLWGYDRLTATHTPRRWARAYLALDTALLLVLLWAAFQALRLRLV